MPTLNTQVTQEEIARRAYEIWQSRGCPQGDGSDDWQAAEAELIGTRISRNSAGGRGAWNWWCRVRDKITGQETRA
jgi:hypothetical protein